MLMLNGLYFERTCIACPEQYDVYDDDANLVGYVRLRHGYLSCKFPDSSGKIIYQNDDDVGDGIFKNENIRMFHLNKIATKIRIEIGKNV